MQIGPGECTVQAPEDVSTFAVSERPPPPDQAGWWIGALAAGALAACGGGDADTAPAHAGREGAAAAGVSVLPVYRFAKISNGAYFYTGNRAEKDLVLSSYPDLRYEGIAFQQLTDGSGVPVYRFANLGNGGYFYTASAAERDWVEQTRPDMRYEGSTFSVASGDHPGALPVYRLANLVNKAYLYTASAWERDAAIASGIWRDEGVAFHTLPAPASPVFAETDAEASRFLQHATYGATDADIAAVREQGYAAWLDTQMALPRGQRAWDWMVSAGYAAIDERALYDNGGWMAECALAREAAMLPDGVRQRVALAMSEFFVVSSLVAQMPWAGMGMAHYWDQLKDHAFGNFRDLLEAMTLNPAMGAWLNTRGNLKEDPAIGRVPDENYAREVMQLFSIGLVKLNLDGTPQRGADGQPLPTYTQDDVTQLARIFTGWDWWDDGRRFLAPLTNNTRPYPEFTRRAMVFEPSRHSTRASVVLGRSIAAGSNGPARLKAALDILFQHPNVGPFFGRQMIQRLVTSQPSPAYVARVAAAFNDNGAGVRGDLKAVWRAILLDEEARGPVSLTSPTHGKVREPMVRVLQWLRTFGARSPQGTWVWPIAIGDATRWYGQRPLTAPSVFNWFRPGYVPPGTAMADAGATAPEFQIINESSVSQWINAIDDLNLAASDAEQFPWCDFQIGLAAERALAHDAGALVRRLNVQLAAGQLSPATEQRLIEMINLGTAPPTSANDAARRWRAIAAITLVMSCPEYIVQK